MADAGQKPRPSAALESAAVQRRGRLARPEGLAAVSFDEEGLELPGVLEVQWAQAAVADVAVRDHGRRVELCLCSRGHETFDFVRLALPMGPDAARLLQVLHASGVRMETVPGLLLRWPLAGLYRQKGIRLTEALLCHGAVSTAVEMLFGLMFLTSARKVLGSAGAGLGASLAQLAGDLQELFGQDPGPQGNPLDFLRPLVGDDSGLLWAVEIAILGFMRTCWPLRLVLYCAWHLADFASDLLVLLLLVQHLFVFGYFLSRIVSTVGTVIRLVKKVVQLVTRVVAYCLGRRAPPASKGKAD